MEIMKSFGIALLLTSAWAALIGLMHVIGTAFGPPAAIFLGMLLIVTLAVYVVRN